VVKIYMKIMTFILVLSFAAGSLSAQTKVACVGNSITEGWHGNPSYVPPLQNLLGTNYTVRNYGKSGATALKKGDVPYWTQGVFTQALKSNADIITIMLGTNDTKSKNWDSYGSEFKSDYAALIDTLQSANKNAQIFPVIPVPVFRDNYGIRNEILKLEIPIIEEIANEKGLTVIDANTPLLPFSSYFPDGVHPNAAGADTIASVLFRSIKTVTSVEARMIETPSLFSLCDNYPNPFNPSTKINFSLPYQTKVRINVYDILGRKVAELINGEKSAGTYEVNFEAENLSSGVYIYQLEYPGQVISKKMLLMK